MSLISNRMSQVKPSPTLAINSKAAELKSQGKDVIGLGAGEPDFDTPDHIKEAAIQALKQGKTKYVAVEGILPLRKAICAKLKRDNDIDYTPEQVIVGIGAKYVLFNAFVATLNKGDEVIIPAPYWVSYPDMVQISDGTPVIVTCTPENHFKLKPEDLEKAITSKTKWLIINSPSNPTGMAYTKAELEALAVVLRKHPQVHVMSDDIYEKIVYDGFEFATLAQVAPDLKDRILTVNGLSKSYSMTGWRIGYGAGPRELIKAMTTLQSQSATHATSFCQEASVVALEGPQDFIEERNKVFKERRDRAAAIFNETPGLSCLIPQGAFYLYPSCQGIMGKTAPDGTKIITDSELATYLLESARVAIVPGVAFGLSPYFRISTATDTNVLVEACTRISDAIRQLK